MDRPMRAIAFLLGAAAAPVVLGATITFTATAPTVGLHWREAGTVVSQLKYESDIGGTKQEGETSSSADVDAEYVVTAAAADRVSALIVQYHRHRSTSGGVGSSSGVSVSPLEGNRYDVTFTTGGDPVIRRPDGSTPSADETAQVREATQPLSQPNALGPFLAGAGALAVGDRLSLPANVLRDAWDSPLFEAKRIELELTRVITSPTGLVGAFAVEMVLANPAGAPYKINARIEGTMWIHSAGSRILRSKLAGPVKIDSEWGTDPVIRMKGTGTVTSSTERIELP